MKICICGDVHGKWKYLNDLIRNEKPDILLSCGDFGYWPRFRNLSIDQVIAGDTKIYFCDGNHEDHWALIDLTDNEVAPNVFYMKRGSTLTLPDGRVVMFFGGADSIDKGIRLIGVDWFPEEVISYKDMTDLPNTKIDIMITHTCPDWMGDLTDLLGNAPFTDPSRQALSQIFDMYKPALWFFGHWHGARSGEIDGCRWEMLNMAGCYNWYTVLEEV